MRLKILVLLSVLVVATLVWAPGAVQAATITVNTTTDVVNSTDGLCSLREAITAANTDTVSGATGGECTAGGGADTITVPAGTYTLTVAGTGEDSNVTGDLDVVGDLTLTGADAATTLIDGGLLDRVIDVKSPAP